MPRANVGITRLSSSISTCDPPIMLLGARGVGKTVIIKQLI